MSDLIWQNRRSDTGQGPVPEAPVNAGAPEIARYLEKRGYA